MTVTTARWEGEPWRSGRQGLEYRQRQAERGLRPEEHGASADAWSASTVQAGSRGKRQRRGRDQEEQDGDQASASVMPCSHKVREQGHAEEAPCSISTKVKSFQNPFSCHPAPAPDRRKATAYSSMTASMRESGRETRPAGGSARLHQPVAGRTMAGAAARGMISRGQKNRPPHAVDFLGQRVDFGFCRIGRRFGLTGSRLGSRGSRIRLSAFCAAMSASGVLAASALAGVGVGVGSLALLNARVCCGLGLGHSLGRGAPRQQSNEKTEVPRMERDLYERVLFHVLLRFKVLGKRRTRVNAALLHHQQPAGIGNPSDGSTHNKSQTATGSGSSDPAS